MKFIFFFNRDSMTCEMWFQKIVWFMWKQSLWKNHNDVIEIKCRCHCANLMTQRKQKTVHSKKLMICVENKMITSSNLWFISSICFIENDDQIAKQFQNDICWTPYIHYCFSIYSCHFDFVTIFKTWQNDWKNNVNYNH